MDVAHLRKESIHIRMCDSWGAHGMLLFALCQALYCQAGWGQEWTKKKWKHLVPGRVSFTGHHLQALHELKRFVEENSSVSSVFVSFILAEFFELFGVFYMFYTVCLCGLCCMSVQYLAQSKKHLPRSWFLCCFCRFSTITCFRSSKL